MSEADRKPRLDSPLRNLPEERQEAIMELLADKTLDEVRKQLAADGIKCSAKALSKFRQWRLQRDRLDKFNDTVDQFESFYTKVNPNATREKVRDMGIAFFMAEAAGDRNQKAFLDVAKLSLKDDDGKRKDRSIDLDVEKFRAAMKGKIDTALDALFEEIKENQVALDLFKKFKAAIQGATA